MFNKRPTLHQDFTPNSVQNAIEELQTVLHEKGLLSNLSGRFDTETEAAVKVFQEQNHLLVDGIVGPLTWACLYYPKLSRTCKKASAVPQDKIRELQSLLAQEGFFNQEPGGQFDHATERAVKRFQKTYGLRADGVVGAYTWAVLLGMRQKPEILSFLTAIYLLPPHSFFLGEQLLMICLILLGIYHSPLPGSPPELNAALTTAYGLTYVVPLVLERFSLNPRKSNLFLLQYAPYVLTGIFWKAILSLIETRIK
ncbi:MAG: peptidoglycan-binding protein [Kovacikia sp.]